MNLLQEGSLPLLLLLLYVLLLERHKGPVLEEFAQVHTANFKDVRAVLGIKGLVNLSDGFGDLHGLFSVNVEVRFLLV